MAEVAKSDRREEIEFMSYDQKKIVDAIRAFEKGEIVVVMDDDDRENEGDLIVAAVHCTAEKMAFIVRHTSGIVCAPMTGDEADRLHLNPMVANNSDPHATAFTISVDYKHGTTTGISAEDRTSTVRGLANPNSGAKDFSRPGHIFPLVAKEGGVLIRSGHTEAAVDLCKLSKLPQVGVISELVNDDGTVMRGPQVIEFAKVNDLKTISVADLISYRQRQESLIDRIDTFSVETASGEAQAYIYKTKWDTMNHVAVVYGDIRDGQNIPVRLQIESVLNDAFGATNQLRKMMDKISREESGVIVYLREGSVGVATGHGRLKETLVASDREGHETAQSREDEWLEIGLGAQILKDLGIQSIRLYASRERHYVGLEGFGIAITETLIEDN